jgi:hypothetical protein
VATSASRIDVVVSVADGEPLSEVVARLEAAGLEVEQTLADLRIVTGSVERSQAPFLTTVPGVQAVEEARDVVIAPPDAPLQ